MARIVKEKYDRYSVEATEKRRESARLKIAEWRKNNPEKYLAQRKAWYDKNREARQKYGREFYAKNREKWKTFSRRNLLKNTYGITEEDFTAKLDSQGGVCGICKDPNKAVKQMHIDHCHSTGRFRGVLCQRCNHGLGHFRDNRDYLLSAIEYLKENQ